MIADSAVLLPRKAPGKPSVPTPPACTMPGLLAIELKGHGATRIELTDPIDREALAAALDCLKHSREAP